MKRSKEETKERLFWRAGWKARKASLNNLKRCLIGFFSYVIWGSHLTTIGVYTWLKDYLTDGIDPSEYDALAFFFLLLVSLVVAIILYVFIVQIPVALASFCIDGLLTGAGSRTTQRKCDKERIAKGLAKNLSCARRFGKYKKCVDWFYESEVDVVFRVVRFQLASGNWETIVTTLPADEFSVEDIKELYFMRWNNIEKGFKIPGRDNQLLRMHSRLPDSVRQEIHARVAMHNLVSCFVAMAESIGQLVEKDDCVNGRAVDGNGNATGKGKREPIEKHLINRRFATYITCEFLRCDRMVGVDVLGEILSHKVPVRDGRSFKRTMRPIGFFLFGYR